MTRETNLAAPTATERGETPSAGPSDRPIRLLIILARYWPGFSGTAIQHHEILKHLGPSKVKATVLTLRQPGLPKRDVRDQVAILRLGPGGVHRRARLLFVLQTLGHILLRGRSYDVIHTYAAGWAGFLAPLAARLVAVPIVFSSTLQGADDPASIRSQDWGRVKMRLLRLTRKITACTPQQAELFTTAGFGSDSVLTLTCGIDDRLFVPGTDEACRRSLRKAAGRDDEGPVILFIGTLTQRKGVDLLVETFQRLLSRHPTAVLVLMGPKSRREDETLDEEFVASLQARCESPDLTGHVVMLGRIDSKERKRSILQASDLFALFSRHEGLGIVVLEAMAAGVPPILTSLPGVFDYMVEDGENGRICASRDPAELSDILHEVLSSAERRAAMGKEARETVTQRFSLSLIASQYFDLYSHLANRV